MAGRWRYCPYWKIPPLHQIFQPPNHFRTNLNTFTDLKTRFNLHDSLCGRCIAASAQYVSRFVAPPMKLTGGEDTRGSISECHCFQLELRKPERHFGPCSEFRGNGRKRGTNVEENERRWSESHAGRIFPGGSRCSSTARVRVRRVNIQKKILCF